jgi:CBS domain-containing protein
MFDFDVRAGNEIAAPETMGSKLSPERSRTQGLRDEFFSEPVSKVPRRTPLVLTPSGSIRDALKRMEETHAAAALVISHGVLLGTLSEREIIRRSMGPIPTVEDLPVWKVMLAKPETLLESDSISYALRKLSAVGGRALPVLDRNGDPCGLIESHDVVAWLCDLVGSASVPAAGPVHD